MSDAGADRDPAPEDFAGVPREGEHLPEEQQAGHPHTHSSPAARERDAGVDGGADAERAVRRSPATGNPHDTPR
jgi:hypothetical protein